MKQDEVVNEEVEGDDHQLSNVVVQGIPHDGLAENNVVVVQGVPHRILGENNNEASDDNDAEFAELSRLRCTSIRTEEIADREKRKQQRRTNRCADYPGLAFGSAAFGSETMMKYVLLVVLCSSEKRGLCLMKCSSKTHQNLAYFINTKTQSCFLHFSFCATLFFP